MGIEGGAKAPVRKGRSESRVARPPGRTDSTRPTSPTVEKVTTPVSEAEAAKLSKLAEAGKGVKDGVETVVENATPLKSESTKEKTDAKETKDSMKTLSEAQKKGLIDSRDILEILAARGDVGKFLEEKAKKLMVSAKPKDKAMGLDMLHEGLLIQVDNLKKPQIINGQPVAVNSAKIAQIEAQITETHEQRRVFNEKHPDLVGNQFEGMAKSLVPTLQADADGKILGLKSMNDFFDTLTQTDNALEGKTQRKEALKHWEAKGVPEKVVKNLEEILFKNEIGETNDKKEERKDKIKGKAKKIAIILAFLTAMGVYSAAKKESGGGPGGGH